MNSYESGVSIDPEFPVRNDRVSKRPSCKASMATLRAARRGSDYRPLKGEITMKAWRSMESERIGLGPGAIIMRLMRGKYPNLKIRRVNKRVVYVST